MLRKSRATSQRSRSFFGGRHVSSLRLSVGEMRAGRPRRSGQAVRVALRRGRRRLVSACCQPGRASMPCTWAGARGGRQRTGVCAGGVGDALRPQRSFLCRNRRQTTQKPCRRLEHGPWLAASSESSPTSRRTSKVGEDDVVERRCEVRAWQAPALGIGLVST